MFGLFKGSLQKSLTNRSYATYFSKSDRHEIEKTFARVFSTEEGKKALAYLQYITCERALPADVDQQVLRYTEGQRALIGNILRMIQNGQK